MSEPQLEILADAEAVAVRDGQAYVGTDVPPYPYPNFKGVVTNVLYNFGGKAGYSLGQGQ
mgnify:CR=1 FL=1